MILEILGWIAYVILILLTVSVVRIIRQRVYVQFYLSFASLILLVSTIIIPYFNINKLYSICAIIIAVFSLYLPTIFIILKLNFLNSIIRFISDIYREIILFGLSNDEMQTRINAEQERISSYWDEIAEETAKKYKEK